MEIYLSFLGILLFCYCMIVLTLFKYIGKNKSMNKKMTIQEEKQYDLMTFDEDKDEYKIEKR